MTIVYNQHAVLDGTDDGGSTNLNFRQLYPKARLSLATGTQFRITIRAGTGNVSSLIDSLYFGRSTQVDSTTYNGNQVAVTWSGSGSVALSGASAQVVSDWMNFLGGETFDNTFDYIGSWHGNSGSTFHSTFGGLTGSDLNTKAGADESALSSVSGYAQTSNAIEFVVLIEVQTPIVTTGDTFGNQVNLIQM